MRHPDHVALLRDGVPRRTGTWADLGAGAGAFTLALAELLAPDSRIYAIDKDAAALRDLDASRSGHGARIETRRADFTTDLGLRDLDGVVMANSLHFIGDKAPVLARVRGMLRPAGALLLVEYDADRGNMWVPFPLSFTTWQRLAVANGFTEPRLIGAHPSRFLGRIYSARCEVAAGGSTVHDAQLARSVRRE